MNSSSEIALSDQWFQLVLSNVEHCLDSCISSELNVLNEAASHLLRAGGKRLRPALAAASFYACQKSESQVESLFSSLVNVCASVELVHLASLYHDDVMDDAEKRRGVPSVNYKWGNTVAIVAGDYLLAQSAKLAATEGSEIVSELSLALSSLCEGQISEVETVGNVERSEKSYFNTIKNKTGALFRCAAAVGAMVSGAEQNIVDMLKDCGMYIGVAFQIKDDLMDIYAPLELTGKNQGQDLLEGVYTLPIIISLASPNWGNDLKNLLVERPQGWIEDAITLISLANPLERCVQLYFDYLQMAKDLVTEMDTSSLNLDSRRLLFEYIDFLRSDMNLFLDKVKDAV